MKPDPHGQSAVTTWKVMGRTSFPGKVIEAGDADVLASPHHGNFAADLPGSRGEGNSITWLALEPLTGRTHQLRVHCAAMGWPIVGDAIYGKAPRAGGPLLHLHAREIEVPLYKNREPIRVMAPVPLHMQERLYACGWQGEVFRLIG
jgi:tRNA pseudouridine32 synthase/23S rRNA pseudouridine746 synthase